MLEYQKPHSFVDPRRRMISRFGSSSEVSMVALLHKKQQGYPNHDGFVHSLTSIANKSRSKWDSHRSDLTRLSYLNGGLVPYIYSTWGSHKITVVQPTQITVWEPAQSVSTRLISLISRKLHETLDVPDSLFWRNVKHVPSRNMSQPSVNGRNCLYDWVSPARYVLYRFVQWSIGQHPRLFFWVVSEYPTFYERVLPFVGPNPTIKQTLWFNAHWVEFPILLLVLDLYQIWDGSPFKPVLRARWLGDDAAGSVSEVLEGKLKNYNWFHQQRKNWFSHSSGYFHSVAYGYFRSYSNYIASMCHGLTLCYELLEADISAGSP